MNQKTKKLDRKVVYKECHSIDQGFAWLFTHETKAIVLACFELFLHYIKNVHNS